MFLTPLRAASLNEQTAIISAQQVKNMFPNIEIIYNVNKQFLADLQERFNNWSIQQRIGDIFLRMVRNMSLLIVNIVFNWLHSLSLPICLLTDY